MEYTKGKWEAQKRENFYRIYTTDGTWMADIADSFGTNDEDKANAYLIAAAPDMYKALQSIRIGSTDILAVGVAEQVLAKAEGVENG